jgi:nitrate reductase NapD
MTHSETHISSYVIQALPNQVLDVERQVAQCPGVEVYAFDPVGKIIVTMEVADERLMRSFLDDVTKIKGVLTASLVFHQIEQNADLSIAV